MARFPITSSLLIIVVVAVQLIAAADKTLADLEQDVSTLERLITAKSKSQDSVEGSDQVESAKDKFDSELKLIKSIEATNTAEDLAATEPDQELNTDAALLKAIQEGNSKHGIQSKREKQLDEVIELMTSNDVTKKEVDVDILSNKDKCKDTLDRSICKRYVSEGRCASSEEAMVERCAMSCGFCCFDMADSSLCQVLRDKQKLCDRDPKRMHAACMKTCGLCFKRAPAVPPCMESKFGCCWDRATIAKAIVGSPGDGCPPCKNRNSNLFCNRFKIHCQAGFDNGYDVWRNCPVTCGACKGNCADHPDEAKNCAFYKDQGYCKMKRDSMKFFCKRTCDLCGCSDRSVACRQISSHRECGKYAPVVRAMCKAKCGLC